LDNDDVANEYDHSYENIDEEEIRDRRGSLRVVIFVVSAIIALSMLAVPVFRVIDWGSDGDDPNTAASDARAFVAARFANDALARRSAISASQWALPDLKDEIVAIVDDVTSRPAEELTGAAVSLARVDCNGGADDDSECFHAWMRQPGEADLIRVKLTVSIVNGNARVIEIERVGVV
jgi:hypothetical protein